MTTKSRTRTATLRTLRSQSQVLAPEQQNMANWGHSETGDGQPNGDKVRLRGGGGGQQTSAPCPPQTTGFPRVRRHSGDQTAFPATWNGKGEEKSAQRRTREAVCDMHPHRPLHYTGHAGTPAGSRAARGAVLGQQGSPISMLLSLSRWPCRAFVTFFTLI